MSDFIRYAVYWLPDGALGRWGESWLGWRMSDGTPLPRPDIPGLPRPLPDLTAAATVYGLHATIKPPFRLAAGQDRDALLGAFAAFCAGQSAVRSGPLEVSTLDGFLALTPTGDCAGLTALAAAAVATLDRFRAPPSEAEVARRRAAGLTARQDELLRLWGYPYVMEAFRMHVTLTGRLPKAEAAQVQAVLSPLVAPLLGDRLDITHLSLVGERAQGGFQRVAHHALAG